MATARHHCCTAIAAAGDRQRHQDTTRPCLPLSERLMVQASRLDQRLGRLWRRGNGQMDRPCCCLSGPGRPGHRLPQGSLKAAHRGLRVVAGGGLLRAGPGGRLGDGIAQ